MKFAKEHWIEVCCVCALIFVHLWLLAETYHGDHIDAQTAGQYGDFIGGYAGTIFLVISVALLAASYRHQKSTNEQTLQQQTATNARTAFESRFFELLRYHRENVSEIGIGSDKTGRRVFVSLIREFREALNIVSESCTAIGTDYPKEKRLDLAYMAFYYGVGPNSSRVLEAAISHHPAELVERVIDALEKTQSSYRAASTKMTDPLIGDSERESQRRFRDQLTRVSYCPFDGHQSRLGHYYRHLFQLVKYLDKHAPKGNAREYADIARAQLTNHEQALLCLNALSTVGAAWISRKYLTDYSLIQNIPKSFFNPETELNIEKQFPEIEFEFQKPRDCGLETNRSTV